MHKATSLVSICVNQHRPSGKEILVKEPIFLSVSPLTVHRCTHPTLTFHFFICCYFLRVHLLLSPWIPVQAVFGWADGQLSEHMLRVPAPTWGRGQWKAGAC